MRPILSDDQELLRATTARFLDEFVPPAELRRLRHDPVGFERDYWRQGAELGWTSLLVSEEHGGGSISDEGLVDLTLVAHEFGTHAAPGPLLSSNLVASALSRAGSHPDVLSGLLAGTSIAAWCGAEAVSRRASGGVVVTVDGGDLVLDGTARSVESASVADHLLVTSRVGSTYTQLLVPTDSEGISITPMGTVDLTRRFSVVGFDGVRVPAAAAVGEIGGAHAAVEHQVLVALVVGAAESVGAMQHAFDMTVEWAFDRYSFGRPLASYQALKHRFADMKAWLEGGHAIADAAASAVCASDPRAELTARAAKAFVDQYGSELMQDCVQLHGGLGVTFEHDVHLYFRRHTLDRTLFGTPTDQYQAITDLLDAKLEGAA